MDDRWSVYIVECADGSLYTGVARSVTSRVSEHNLGKGAKYTKARLPVELVYREGGFDQGDALRREHEIKKLTRVEKVSLIEEASE